MKLHCNLIDDERERERENNERWRTLNKLPGLHILSIQRQAIDNVHFSVFYLFSLSSFFTLYPVNYSVSVYPFSSLFSFHSKWNFFPILCQSSNFFLDSLSSSSSSSSSSEYTFFSKISWFYFLLSAIILRLLKRSSSL